MILPILTILIFLRKNPLDFGFRLGNYKLWGFYIVITVVVVIIILYIVSLFLSVGQYDNKYINYNSFFSEAILSLFAWEYILRGFLLFGLKEKFREASILIPMVPFVLLHFGEPEIKVLMCIPAGIWFGYIAYRGKSFWPVFIIHTFINIILKYFAIF